MYCDTRFLTKEEQEDKIIKELDSCIEAIEYRLCMISTEQAHLEQVRSKLLHTVGFYAHKEDKSKETNYFKDLVEEMASSYYKELKKTFKETSNE